MLLAFIIYLYMNMSNFSRKFPIDVDRIYKLANLFSINDAIKEKG